MLAAGRGVRANGRFFGVESADPALFKSCHPIFRSVCSLSFVHISQPCELHFHFLGVREQEKAEQSLKSVIWFLKKSDRRIILIPPRWPVNIVFSCRWRGFSVENMNNKTLYRAKVSTFQRWKHFGSKSFQQIFQLCENQMLSILYISTKYHQNV